MEESKTRIARLAILDRGEPAVRAITAVANLAQSGERITSVLVHVPDPAGATAALPWYAREADEVLTVPATLTTPGVPGRGIDPAALADALVGAGVDSVWLRRTPTPNAADLAAACEERGLRVLGASSEVLRRYAEPGALAAAAAEVGIGVAEDAEGGAELRRIQVATLRDAAGTAWAVGLREAVICRGKHLVFTEFPATLPSPELAERITTAAVALMERAGFVGAAVSRFFVDPDTGEITLAALDLSGRPEHGVLLDTTGVSLVSRQLRLALGGSLEPAPPTIDGHLVEARILAQDPGADFAPTGGRVELIALPTGSGVNAEASLRVGDIVDAEHDPVIAAISAWGRDRGEAMRRLRIALERTQVLLAGGSTNRTALLSLLNRPEIQAGPVTGAWYDDLLASGATVPVADPLALVAAAVEIYRGDFEEVLRAFRSSAERGRPEHPEHVGARMQLSYRGVTYRLRADRIAADRFRITDTASGGATVDAVVDVLGDFERRVTVGGHKRRVLAMRSQDNAEDVIRLEIDGVAHQVTREDGITMRTGWPALIESLLVAPGQIVTRGQPVAVLESMKMVTTVTAPVDGQVSAILVLPNSQVDRGVPILRIRPSNPGDASAPSEAADTASADAAADAEAKVDLAALTAPRDGSGTAAGETLGGTRGVFARLRDYLLGYDLDQAGVKALFADHKAYAQSCDPLDPALLADEDALLDLFADIGSLYRPRTEAEASAIDDLTAQTNTQENFHAFLRWLEPVRAGLSTRYLVRLQRALERYGVADLDDAAALPGATLWMFRSFERVPAFAPIILAVLGRRMQQVEALIPIARTPDRGRLQRLVQAADGRQQAVADLARDLLFQLFEEPMLAQAQAATEAQMFEHIEALAHIARGEDRTKHIKTLVAQPYPMRAVLLEGWLKAAPAEPTEEEAAAYRRAVLETYIQRFYRTRALENVGVEVVDGLDIGHAAYAHDGDDVYVVVVYLPLSDLPAAARKIARHLGTEAFQRDAVVDVVAWRDDVRPSIDELAAETAQLLVDCDFGRPLRRLDVTVTSLADPRPSREKTQHLTYRTGDDGLLREDVLYRNMHPMLSKRLDLWRLANFDLVRLPSAEDVYVFEGVAKENPKDRRIFALGEVRDLEPLYDEQTGRTAYPRLGRIGLEALSAMRRALATYPPRERPTANRLVLTIRPVWNIPPRDWQGLAATYEDMARGAGLEKVVLHVSMPEKGEDGQQVLRDRVLTLAGLGQGAMTISVGAVGPNPVRSLTPYAQKVLTAARFGAPYPFEIVKMLTPSPGDASPFPVGSFQEMDLGDDDELVAVHRPAGQNSAHLVVGLMTNYTTVVPEGMTRVAILSDPTQGLGNLAEPECRRINAALVYAAQHKIPVEWYAVSSGALIAMDSGTENMDFIALTLRRIIEFTQGGGEINIIVTGINVGGQPYWNAEATMLMHTKGILVMTPASAMVLTGKQALDFSGAVSADDNFGIGGYDRIMGLNGQAQYWAPSFPEACQLLLHHYDFAYVVPGERFPRRRPTTDNPKRDVCLSPHNPVPGSSFTTVGDIFDHATNPERKMPFDMRSVMRAVSDTDAQPMERWEHWADADTVIVWDSVVGGIPVCMLAMESRSVPRRGWVPSYGPPSYTSGTLFPQSSRKAARAINASSGNRPLVVLANLSGFDGSPESMRNWQLEYGAEIGRAITNFNGPIVFVVVSRYHGGAFVVFSKQLTESMEIAAVEGAYASVIGGAPAAATVFAREVKIRTDKDSRVVEARAAAAAAKGAEAGALRATAARITEQVRSERLREVADEFDAIHTIERAQRMGSVDSIIKASEFRPYVIGALERAMAKTLRG